MDRINQTVARLVSERGGNKAQIAKDLKGITPQAVGNYVTGKRKVPTSFIQKWKEAYGDDIIKLSETNVSHETPGVKVLEIDVWDEIKGTHKDLRENNKMFQVEIDRLWALVNRLAPGNNGEPVKTHKA